MNHTASRNGIRLPPAYLKIADIRQLLPGVPVIALTATATWKWSTISSKRLQFRQENVFRMSFERKNLAYVVRHTEDKESELLHILQRVDGSGIVYTRNRKKTKEISSS